MTEFRTDNTGFTKAEAKEIQRRLSAHGFDPGPIDGDIAPPARAPQSTSAIVAFKRSIGLVARPYVGPITLEALRADGTVHAVPDVLPPWIKEGLRIKGWHERADNTRLRSWLASDGHALGDPAVYPWCGDYAETCIRLGLPGEPFPGDLGRNPYWALNWRGFGVACDPAVGAVISITRKGGGHVGFAVGQDASRIFVLGGNQSNRVSIVPIDKGRFVAASWRWPLTWPGPRIPLPTMTTSQASSINFS